MMDCIFCKIISGEIPSKIVHSTDDIIVINDISPQAPVHLLIIPKTHYPTLLDCGDAGLLGRMLTAAKEVSENIKISERGFRVVLNTNAEGGQMVYHLHMHLLAGKGLSGRMG